MASSVADALRVSQLLGQQDIMDVDYSKYENIKLAAQKRKTAGETNKSRNKKILVSPRAFRPVNGQSQVEERNTAALVTSSCQKSISRQSREAFDERRCRSETKEVLARRGAPPSCRDLNTDRINDILKRDKVSIRQVIRRDNIQSSTTKRGDLKPRPLTAHPDSVQNLKVSEERNEHEIIKDRKERPLQRHSSPIPKRESSPVPSNRASPVPLKRGSSPVPNKREPSPKPTKQKHSPVLVRREGSIRSIQNEGVKQVVNDELNHSRSRRRHSSERLSREPVEVTKKSEPLMDVRRRLEFDNEGNEELEQKVTQKGLDFTDKIAALRSLMRKESETKNISDRRAYYNEYQTSARNLADIETTLKNRQLGEDFGNVNNNYTDEIRPVVKETSSREKTDKRLRAQSADIFKSRHLGEKISDMDLQTIRDRLNQRLARKTKTATIDGSTPGKESGGNVESGEDLIHASSGRKILVSSRKQGTYDGDQKMDISAENDEDSRPSSRLETKETQTNTLNQSIRSVQSNVPCFESLGRPISAPLFDCEVTVGKRKIYKQTEQQPRDSSQVKSQTKGLSLEKASRQSNVNGNQRDIKDYNKQTGDQRGRSEAWSMKANMEKNKRYDKEMLMLDESNIRPSSRCSQSENDEEIQKYSRRAERKRSSSNHRRSQSAMNEVEVLRRKTKETEIDHAASKSERKVKEWIRKQELLNKDKTAREDQGGSGPVMMEELNVSISIPMNGYKDMKHSPSDSCDRIPVKLEKPAGETPHMVPQHGAVGILETKHGDFDGLSDRQAIFDRLERITMAVMTKQHQFEVDIPVKNLKPKERSVPQVRSPKEDDNSESCETESSVFSLPFSIRSGESISSTVQAVKLLRKLYHVDSEQRQNLVLMAKCFRRWFNNVLHARARNQQITQAAKRVSPVSYGVMLRKGDICYRDSLLGHCFHIWREAYRHSQIHNRVEQLYRRHMLQKGMNAFKWAINRSKLQHGIMQDRLNSLLLQSHFNKWRQRTEENCRLRVQQAFLRWRQFTKEAQKIRLLRCQTNLKLKLRVFAVWYEFYQTRQHEHKADRHRRQVVLSQGWLAWRCFTVSSKEKKLRNTMAREMFQLTLQRKMFTVMKVEFTKYNVANNFHRRVQLKLAVQAWRVGVKISSAERESDLQVAQAYWARSTLRAHFTAWRDSLLNNRACRLYNNNIVKNAFMQWHTLHSDLVERRVAVDTYRRLYVQGQAFRRWLAFVTLMKRRREAATQCLHSVLQRHMLARWRWYTAYQKTLRKRMLLHVRKHNLDRQRHCLLLWRSQFKVRCDEKKAQLIWSHSCAKKAADIWRHVCHKRRLARLLIDTEPLRQLHTLQVHMRRWRERYEAIMEEKREAQEVRAILDLSQLRTRFTCWREQTDQVLRIKPMLQRYTSRLQTDCFHGWREYVQHKAQCVQSEQQTRLVLLRNKFAAWRRQYQVHQTEKVIRAQCVQRQSQRCLQAWRGIIQRKHDARTFHSMHLQRRMFNTWNMLALRQIRQKHMEQMQMETVLSSLREYFDRWRAQVVRQQTQEVQATTYLQTNVYNNRLKVAFTFWRRHFRATLVARENEKIRVRRLARQALQCWHQYSKRSLQDAVERFAASIGLLQPAVEEEFGQEAEIDTEYRGEDLEASLARGEQYEPMNFDLALTPRSVTPKTPRTPRTPRTPITPKYASSFGTPMKRIHSPALSQASLARSMDFDLASPLVSSSFLDARFEMEQAVKTESRREIVVTVVHRLRHWPVSIMFDQWRDYTARQRELKLLSTQMITVHKALATRQYFITWLNHFNDMRLAKQHYEQVLQHKALLSLILYRNHRQTKKQMSSEAQQHYARKVYTRIFPWWLEQAQEKRKSERIVHLWTNITDEERELIPRERSFRYKLNKQTTAVCFNLWVQKYRRVHKLKMLYHRILMERYFYAWSTWALERTERRKKCEEYRTRRIKTLVWRTWCQRHSQKVEVERRYQDTWHNYLGLILRAWTSWANDQRRRGMASCYIVAMRDRHLVTRMFHTWKVTHQKYVRVTRWQENRLMSRVVYSWRCVAVWQKDLRRRQHQCQIQSYTSLVKRSFSVWYEHYQARLEQHRHHEMIVQQRLLRMATHWRKRARKTRGEMAKQNFQKQMIGRLFGTWRAAYDRNLARYGELEMHVSHKNQVLMSRCLATWRTELMCVQAQRVFNMKLLVTLTEAWKHAAAGCRERRQRLQAYQSQKNNSTQKVYFLYWFNVAKARKSIRGHANLKIQLNVFRAWLVYTRKQINLRRLEASVTKRRHHRVLQKTWYIVKTRFDYCTELREMAGRVIQEKQLTLMRHALLHWQLRLNIVIADECHEHLLAKRVASRWVRFVRRRREERQHMADMTTKAVNFYHRKLCNKVYRSWRNEVLASKLAEQRRERLCNKFAQLWKTRVDMAVTAQCMREENLLANAWRKWHLEYVRYKTVRKVEAFEKKHQMTMVFLSWKNLCRKRGRKQSMIPLPVSPVASLPAAGTSSNTSSMEDLRSSQYSTQGDQYLSQGGQYSSQGSGSNLSRASQGHQSSYANEGSLSRQSSSASLQLPSTPNSALGSPNTPPVFSPNYLNQMDELCYQPYARQTDKGRGHALPTVNSSKQDTRDFRQDDMSSGPSYHNHNRSVQGSDSNPPAFWVSRPTQIPMPSQAGSVNANTTHGNPNVKPKSRLPSLTSRNSPTNASNEKLSAFSFNKKDSLH